MKYKCQFPDCNYETNIKSQINFHHIIPKELNGCDKSFNIISLCPNHHTKIFIPESKHGNHTMKGSDSIIIIRWLNNKTILQYIDCIDEKIKYHLLV